MDFTHSLYILLKLQSKPPEENISSLFHEDFIFLTLEFRLSQCTRPNKKKSQEAHLLLLYTTEKRLGLEISEALILHLFFTHFA